MDEYYIAIKRGFAEEAPEYPKLEPPNKVQIWHIAGPMEKNWALGLLRRRVQEFGEPNVELLIKLPWAAIVSVHSDVEFKVSYPNEDENTN